MSTATVRLITGLVLFIHGIGHVMAFMPALNLDSNDNWHHRSWLLTGVLGDTASRVMVIILFGFTIIGFLAAGFGLFDWLIPHEWWPRLAIISAIVGLLALAFFWNALATFFPNKIGAIAVNLAVLFGLLGTNALSKMIGDL